MARCGRATPSLENCADWTFGQASLTYSKRSRMLLVVLKGIGSMKLRQILRTTVISWIWCRVYRTGGCKNGQDHVLSAANAQFSTPPWPDGLARPSLVR